MNFKKIDGLPAISQEIRIFADDVYDYIWLRTNFYLSKNKDTFQQDYAIRNPIDIGWELYDYFINRVGKAVRISQFLLREYFQNILNFTMPLKNHFIQELKLMWSHWLEKRNNIFVKVIDTLAILAEALLFCDHSLCPILEVKETKELFIEWFEEELAPDFIKSGGWKVLDQIVIEKYECLESIEPIVNRFENFSALADIKEIYDCQLISLLRNSYVKFPIPAHVLCDKCRHPSDEKYLRRTVYVRLKKEYEDENNTSEDETQDYNANKVERQRQKEEPYSIRQLKGNTPDSEQVQEYKDTISKRKDLENNDDHQYLRSQVSNENTNYESRSLFPNINKENVVSKLDVKHSIDGMGSDDDLSYCEHGKCTSVSEYSMTTENIFPAGETSSKGQKVIKEESAVVITTESKKEADSNLKPDALDAVTYSENQSSLSNKSTKHTDIVSISVVPSSEPAINFQPNYIHQTFTANRISHVTSCQENSVKVEYTRDVLVARVTFPEPSSLEHDLPDKDPYPAKPVSDAIVWKEQQPHTEILNGSSGGATHSPDPPDCSDQQNYTSYYTFLDTNSNITTKIFSSEDTDMFNRKISFHKLIVYNKFLFELQQSVMNPSYQMMSKQNDIHFVSEKYSNSFEKMFKAFFNDEDKPVYNTNNSEKFITMSEKTLTFAKDCELEKTLPDEDFNHFEFVTGEYRYYYFEDEITRLPLKPKKKRKNRSRNKK